MSLWFRKLPAHTRLPRHRMTLRPPERLEPDGEHSVPVFACGRHPDRSSARRRPPDRGPDWTPVASASACLKLRAPRLKFFSAPVVFGKCAYFFHAFPDQSRYSGFERISRRLPPSPGHSSRSIRPFRWLTSGHVRCKASHSLSIKEFAGAIEARQPVLHLSATPDTGST